MKKIFAVFLAVALILTAAIPAFSAPADNTQGLYKYCSDFECAKINKADATVCRKCAKPFDENSASCFEFRNHVDEDEGGSFFRCPECGWISGADETECQYCDASIVGCKKFCIEYGLVCPGCNKYIYRYAPDEFERCGDCGTLINEIEPTRYSSDPLDPDANWDERPVDGNKEPTFFEKLANAFANFFAKIAEFFKKIIDAIGSIFK